PDNTADEFAYDIILGNKTARGDIIKIRLAISRMIRLSPDAELFNEYFNALYSWYGVTFPESFPFLRMRFVMPYQGAFQNELVEIKLNDEKLPFIIPEAGAGMFENLSFIRRYRQDGDFFMDKNNIKRYYPYITVMAQSSRWNRNDIPAFPMTLKISPDKIIASPWFKVRTIANDTLGMKLSGVDTGYITDLLGSLIFYILIMYLFNFIFLGSEIISAGIVITVIDAFAKLDLFNKIFFTFYNWH
ncbi:MAG: hypothetical protein CVT98_08650, partial [Bacteroidetes bacterium HGW-Bacteroidetes-15]